jgi:hypothetical protein
MRLDLLTHSLIAALTVLLPPAARAESATPAATNKFVFALVDGSRIICEPQASNITVATSFEKNLQLPFARISSVKIDRKTLDALVTLVNGDSIKGVVGNQDFRIRTSFGDYTVATTNIETITAAARNDPSVADTPENRKACIDNMRMIEAAKDQWATVAGKVEGNATDTAAISEYLKNNVMPKCPSGGKYTVGAIGEKLRCSVHVVP